VGERIVTAAAVIISITSSQVEDDGVAQKNPEVEERSRELGCVQCKEGCYACTIRPGATSPCLVLLGWARILWVYIRVKRDRFYIYNI
jgi:hypothetical protein